MTPMEARAALLELEVIERRAQAMEKVVAHHDHRYIYQELREVGRLVGSLTMKVKALVEHAVQEADDGK